MSGLGIQTRGTGIARIQKAKGGKVEKVMHEFKAGKLHSGKSGKKSPESYAKEETAEYMKKGGRAKKKK